MTTRTNKKQRLMKSTTTANQLTKRTSHSNVIGHLGNKKDQKDSNHIRSNEYDYTENIEWNTNPRVDLEHNQYGVHLKQNTVITTHYRELPTEIVIQIVDYISQPKDLKACTLVNKQFYAVANRLLWRSPRFNSKAFVKSFVDYLTNSQKQQQQDLPAVGRHIKTLFLQDRFWTDSSVLRLLPQVPNLEELSLLSCREHISRRPLQSLLRHCPHLTSLSILGRHWISESIIMALAQHYPQLRQLALVSVDEIPPNTLEILASCPLESLEFGFLRPNNLSNQHQLLVDLVRYHRHQLKHLVLLSSISMVDAFFTTRYNDHTVAEGDDNDNDNGNTSSNHSANITTPITHWPRLTKLRLQSCNNVDDSIFIAFIKSHPQLQDLDFMSLNITDTALDIMATSLPLLTQLTLTYCHRISGAGARRFIVNSSDCLSYVYLSDCVRIAEEDLPGRLRKTKRFTRDVNLLTASTIRRLRETHQDT